MATRLSLLRSQPDLDAVVCESSVLTGQRFRKRAADIVRRLATSLSPPRDQALVSIAQSAFVLFTGRRIRTGISTFREPRIDTAAYRRAERALEDGDAATATLLIDKLYSAEPRSVRILLLRRAILARTGDLSGQATMLHKAHLLDDEPMNRDAERLVLGRMVEMTPGWLPWIPGRRPVEPAGDGVVLHLSRNRCRS